ncbi:hypothetical protein HJG53_07340 [Sphingomonas sp. ID1715]|uniref:hypothetical protein n=1 Tax=Sphingomonas sp. ID1715 TaxID=1656898 RepID=UPI0014892473|nr:hypothetical protein [Sphingomonas sp. ID1715]NNM76710.1 hypothetical protein [Sphingomonas sp. ID1715]
MKTILLSTALLISGVAYAQADPRDAGQPIGSGATLQPGTTMGERDTMGSNMPAAPTANTTTTTTTDASAGTSTGATMSTDTTATTGAAGTTGSGTMVVQQGGNMTAPPTPRDSYPRCSRTITDNCVQNEARASDRRGGPPARRR